MLRNMKKRLNNRKGFTLIELIVVVAILGVLAAVAVPSYQGYQEKAKLNTNKANMAVIQNAVWVFQAETGELPDDVDDLKDVKYLGKEAPVPILVGDGTGDNDAIADDVFEMDSKGVVTIGQTEGYTVLSGEAVK